ncbi:MAG: response regulator [Planctomycetes bacterium]|nr:response regulator [Planctomycetota bacterium]MBL7043469.1 response regulator [Pirellulaceae bacterium]
MATIHVLLVDDEAEFLEYLKSRLESRGLTVFSAASGLDALRTVDQQRIDVVVLDVRMPGIGGLEVLRKTKQKHPLVEVIMLSGNATVESAIDGLKLGAFDYVTKPCDMSDLLEKINAAYARKETAEEKIRLARLDRIVRHPMAVFDKEE